ncbi:MAG: hypothetical protein DMF72_01750 [Acidobacteria bacterium]|nr:MAG: hypothetical protein DMF72_01750 [Acidobacteriota bacterium]
MKQYPALVSVLIPAHNEEQFIADAIASVHSQTVNASEILVVADACTDRTSQIATELGAKVFELNRRNMAAALNVAVKASAQPWIAFLDADDIWETEKLAWQFKAIDAFPTAGLIGCDYVQLQDGGSTSLSASARRERWDGIDSVKSECCRFVAEPTGELLPPLDLLTTCVMVRREVFDRVGFLDEDFLFGQTMEFFARTLARHPLAFVEKPLAYHRRHEQNHTRNLESYWPTHISIINRMLKHPEQYPTGAGEAYRAHLKRDFHQFERGLLKQQQKAIT